MSGPFFSGYDAWKTRDDNAPTNDNVPEMTFDEWMTCVNDELVNDEYSPVDDEDEAEGLYLEGWQPEDAARQFARYQDRARETRSCTSVNSSAEFFWEF